MATKLKCEICGGKLIGKAGGIYECDSCGMEYDTTWVKEKIQEIQGTVKVEGTVEVTGKVQIEGGTVQVDTAGNKENMLKRGFMLLEEGNWSSADGYFERALELDSECAEAYLGKLLSELKVNNRDLLVDSNVNLEQYRNFTNAYKFGTPELKSWLTETKTISFLTTKEGLKEAVLEILSDGNRYTIADILPRNPYFQNGQVYYASPATISKALTELKNDGLVQREVIDNKVFFCKARAEKADIKQINHLTKNMIAAGYRHTVGLTQGGGLLTFGTGKACSVSGWTDIVAVAAGVGHTVGLKSDGTVVAIGNEKACNVSDWESVIEISAGEDHTVGLRRDGTVIATGRNSFGQCNVGEWTDITEIAAGDGFTVGLRSDGTVVTTEDPKHRYDNIQNEISSWRDIVTISAGDCVVVGVCSDETVVSIDGKSIYQCDVSGWRDIIDVATSGGHTVGLKADGTVVAVGDNDYGQCDVSGWTDVVAIATGVSHTVGLKSNGEILTTGLNDQGQCNTYRWRLFDSIKSLEEQREKIAKERAEIERQRQEEAERRRQAELAEAKRQREEEEKLRIEAEKRRMAEEQRRQAEFARKRKDLSERLASVKQCKQSAETELANLKGLFTGRRRKELEAQIAEADRRINTINEELKKLQ